MDIKLLQVLFLIRYVDEVKGNVDNLVTLFLDEIDADKLALRRQVEESLQRLERETLISRSGDTYFFLTNEERDINREIKSINLAGGEEAKLLGELIFDDVLKGNRKHRFASNKMDFTFNRICDDHPVGHKLDGALNVLVFTPMADEYDASITTPSASWKATTRRARSSSGLKTTRLWGVRSEPISRQTSTSGLGMTAPYPRQPARVHRDLAEENRERRERIAHLVEILLAEAEYFAAGQKLTIKSSVPAPALEEAVDYLIRNTFSKMGYLEKL